MADTQTHANGIENGLEEEDLTKLRPADIDADVKEMERRKRVEMIMNSKLFREELERIIEMQMKDGNGPAGLLQQISDMMGIQAGKLHTTHMFRGSNCVTPINDIRGVESMAYAKGEKNLRCKLASVFRLMDLYGWSQGIHNQITVRLNQDEELFLVNPYGMLYNEITASSLVKVDMQGNVVEHGTTNFSVNTQLFLLHSSIHASRPDIKCIIHIHTPSVLAVSSLKCGLLPLCHEALVIGEVSQHPFMSGIFEPEEREKIIRNLGPSNKILLLNNHGALCCGETVEEAFYNVYNTVLACETQIKLIPVGIDNLVLVNDETRKQVYDAAHRSPESDGDKKKQFRVGELEFEALIRMLDNAGFRTGYIYRHPLVKGEVPKPKNDVEVPPAVSSLGYLIEEEKLYKQGNWKKYVDGRNRLDRTKWLNSPNVYQKVEFMEEGTPDPKKITKWVDRNSEEWVAENSPTHSSTPVKIDSALQFVPKNTNPKEFKKLQQQIKENRLADKITSGPQSHILEGVTWEEAKKLQDANITQTGDQVILVGAASKGIIQRNFQHNALVYKTPYAKNPFDSISDQEIEDYRRLIERKQRGDTDYEESQSESEAVSSRQEALRHIKSPLMSPQSATSETEEESRDEPRVLRIETKTAPRPIQAEVVLSDAEFDTTDARIERSQSARYPKAEKPESVTIVNSFRKSWSLKRDKDKSKDVEGPDVLYSRVPDLSLIVSNFNAQSEESLQACVARIKNLNQTPIGSRIHLSGGMHKSASDPCDLSCLSENKFLDKIYLFDDCQTEPLGADSNLDLKRQLKLRNKLISSAKMKFLGLDRNNSNIRDAKVDSSPASRVCTLISEIREKINQIMSPERNLDGRKLSHGINCLWTGRFDEWNLTGGGLGESKPHQTQTDAADLEKITFLQMLSNTDHAPVERKSFDDIKKKNGIFGEKKIEGTQAMLFSEPVIEENLKQPIVLDVGFSEKTNVRMDAIVIKSLLQELVCRVDTPDEDLICTTATDSEIQSSSFTRSTETEWYYNKSILNTNNSETMVEIKNINNNLLAGDKQSDTGIDIDYASKKDEFQMDISMLEHPQEMEDSSDTSPSPGLNKSSETDFSLLKSSSERTSTDMDTSFIFKTDSEKQNEVAESDNDPVKKIDSCEDNVEILEVNRNQVEKFFAKLPEILESPEFTIVDTEDAPVSSSSKDSSPHPGKIADCRASDEKGEDESKIDVLNHQSKKKKKKRHRNRSSTKITVKKELGEKISKETVVSEIKLTIKNSASFTTEKYEFEIQDEANTSEEMSRTESSLAESLDNYQNYELLDGNCDCEAEKDLKNLQSEVNSTIEKLQKIENYFEGEIKKSTDDCNALDVGIETYNESEKSEGATNYLQLPRDNDCWDGLRKELEKKFVEDADGEMVKYDSDSEVKEPDGDDGGGSVNTSSFNINDISRCEDEVPEICCNEEVTTEPEVSDIFSKVKIDVLVDSNGNIMYKDTKLKLDDLIDFEALLNEIVSKCEVSKCKVSSTINDILNFILDDEESPSDSLAEFEDMENTVSAATDAPESRCNDDCPTDEEFIPGEVGKRKRKRSGNSTFNILIATPTAKEIFINYDEKASSSFSITTEDEAKENQRNSYINIDDVNEDFEHSPEWFAAGSPGNVSFDSPTPDDPASASESCVCREDVPGSLAIIEEVEELES